MFCVQELLADGGIAKVGCGIHGDAQKLQDDWGCTVQGVVELSDVANGKVLRVIEHVTVNMETKRWSLAGRYYLIK